MSRSVRRRFWMEALLAASSALTSALTIAWPEWIEELFGVSPDGGSGAAEWMVAALLGLAAAVLALTARREWRRSPVPA